MKIPEISFELAEETGWHIGDGSMNFYNRDGKLKGVYQLRGHMEDDKQHYIQRIKPFFKHIYGLNLSLREMPSTRVYGFQIWNSELVQFKKELGLPLGKKWDIQIPEQFLNNNELKIAVIRGIFDTDGSINLQKKGKELYPRVYITTICPSLANQLNSILNSLQLKSTLYSELNNQEFNRQRLYRITLRGKGMFHKFMELIEPKNPKHILKYHKFVNSKSL